MPTSLFEYQIVETADGQFMPQRGIPEGDAIASRFVWRDAVPAPAPTFELAMSYVRSLEQFDALQTPGTVRWKSPTAP